MPSDAEHATARFEALMARREGDIHLDEAAMLVAAHAYPDLDVDAELERIDEIAEGCRAPTLDGVLDHLFDDLRLRGNHRDYYDPRNSFLNDVIRRRTGIPITLSILVLEVGRRVGAPLGAVSMPGHFLLRDRVDPALFIDAFAGGMRLDAAAREARFAELHGPGARFDPDFLEPVGAHAVVARLLANLKNVYGQRGDAAVLEWVLRLRTLVPGVGDDDRHELTRLIARWN